jgi:type I restriction enzyme M protein
MTSEQLKELEAILWSTADKLRSNSDLSSNEYSSPILGLIFLKFADNRYSRFEAEIKAEYEKHKGKRTEKSLKEIAIEKCGFYLPDEARYDYLLRLTERDEVDKAIKHAMELIEESKGSLKGALPKDEYFKLTRRDKTLPLNLLRGFSNIPKDANGDVFGHIYEYFLGEFAMAEGQGGGEFFTPRSVVKLMVEIIEPVRGKILDPACGSGGMFVEAAHYIEKNSGNKGEPIDFYAFGQEKNRPTVNLALMNLAVNNIRGEVKQAISYYEDLFGSFENFDYVLANPPFNVDEVVLEKVEKDKRFNTYGIPRNKSKNKKKSKGVETVPNANYLWVNLFATSLKPNSGRAGLVMANSASDARHSEAEIRKRLINENLIYAMVTLPSNMFYTVTLPATLWFFDKGKTEDKILFIDARNIFTQIDRAHRKFTDEHIQNIALISRLRKGEKNKFIELIDSYFARGIEKLEGSKKVIASANDILMKFLNDFEKQELPDLSKELISIEQLEVLYKKYKSNTDKSNIDKLNKAQRELYIPFKSYFGEFETMVKIIDKTIRQVEKDYVIETDKEKIKKFTRDLKEVKLRLDELLKSLKEAEYFFNHISWLQERFPEAKYEDIVGLCKLASIEDIEEQDYSLNSGRYVGVVIEEDGKTEEEFAEEMKIRNDELVELSKKAKDMEKIISENISNLLSEKE